MRSPMAVQEGTGSGSAFGATSSLKNENTDSKRTIALDYSAVPFPLTAVS